MQITLSEKEILEILTQWAVDNKKLTPGFIICQMSVNPAKPKTEQFQATLTEQK